VEPTQDRPDIEALLRRLRDLTDRLQRDQAQDVPPDEPYLASDSKLKGGVTRSAFRAMRPATRRYDRLATELAGLAAELANALMVTASDVERLGGDVDRLDLALQTLRSQPRAPGATTDEGVTVPDDYYWSFEAGMRGSADSVLDRLRHYERLIVPLREALGPEGEPLWIDLGCGLGEFCELLQEWSWRTQGVDASPGAIEACRARGLDATLADVTEFLQTRRGEAPGGISAIQLIEHLPRGRWIPLFEAAREALAPGGAFLVETINGLNPEAVTGYFFADVTHSWPGHPETLKMMARHAGFSQVDIVYLNPDHRGNAQDFAVWARKG
jgi:Cyclopropane fatty acid synthase and related methyltransferases